VGLAGRFLVRRLHGATGRPGPADRGVGALLGAAKGALLAWLLLSILVRLSPLALWSFRLDALRSDLGALAARHDLLGAILPRQAHGLDLVLGALRDPEARARLIRSDPALEKLFEDPRLKPLLDRLASRPGQPAAPEPTPQDLSALEELLRGLRREEARP
jgi:hypothetical protein